MAQGRAIYAAVGQQNRDGGPREREAGHGDRGPSVTVRWGSRIVGIDPSAATRRGAASTGVRGFSAQATNRAGRCTARPSDREVGSGARGGGEGSGSKKEELPTTQRKMSMSLGRANGKKKRNPEAEPAGGRASAQRNRSARQRAAPRRNEERADYRSAVVRAGTRPGVPTRDDRGCKRVGTVTGRREGRRMRGQQAARRAEPCWTHTSCHGQRQRARGRIPVRTQGAKRRVFSKVCTPGWHASFCRSRANPRSAMRRGQLRRIRRPIATAVLSPIARRSSQGASGPCSRQASQAPRPSPGRSQSSRDVGPGAEGA